MCLHLRVVPPGRWSFLLLLACAFLLCGAPLLHHFGEEGAGPRAMPLSAVKARLKELPVGLLTYMDIDVVPPRRAVLVDPDLARLHRENRVEVLQCLHEMATAGTAKEAVNTVGMAIALEEGRFMAVPYAFTPVELVDSPERGHPHSMRVTFGHQIQDYITQASKQRHRGRARPRAR
jgi:hypothetical protein